MSVTGIGEITFGSSEPANCRRFFLDWGLRLVEETTRTLMFESLHGCRVRVAHSDMHDLPWSIELDPTLREVVYLHKQSHTMSEGEISADFQIRDHAHSFIFEKKDQRDVNFD